MNKEQQDKIQPIPEPNSFYERLLELRATNPETFNVISPVSKLALFHYEAGRRRFFELETIRTESQKAE